MSNYPPRSKVGGLAHEGRFQIQKKLADTLQGYIYLATDLKSNGERRVIKEAYIALIESGKSRDGHPVHEDFPHEKKILGYLSKQPDADEGFTKIVCEWQTEMCFYYAMEFCEAELFKFISNSFAQGGQMFEYMQKEKNKPQVAFKDNNHHEWMTNVRSIFRQCVKAVHYFHEKGVCHLDLSLENTMIYKEDGLKIKVIDFGLGKYWDYKNPTKLKEKMFQNSERVGKRGYMAPEVYNKMVYDARKADIWCLAVMLFMMAIGAPPYKRATQRDAAFNYIINGMLEDVLKHWKRLTLISADCLDCMLKMFRWEKDRISMKELIAHPFVDLEAEINAESADQVHSMDRIREALTEFHKEYALPVQALQAEDASAAGGNEGGDPGKQGVGIQIQTQMADESAKYKMPKFNAVCKKAMDNGAVRLLDDFRYVLHDLTIHPAVRPRRVSGALGDAVKQQQVKPDPKGDPVGDDKDGDESKEQEPQSFETVCQDVMSGLSGQAFIQSKNSVILRRCFRDRGECEDERALLKVYGKDSRSVIQDDAQRMTMQIMDKLYCFFAYAHELGFAFTDDEIVEIETAMKQQAEDQETDGGLLRAKGILQRKKQEMLQTEYGKQFYAVLQRRKIKFTSSSKNFEVEESKMGPHDAASLRPAPAMKLFEGIRQKMEQYLAQIKKKPQTMETADFVRFVNIIRQRARRNDSHALHATSTEQWDKLKATFERNAVDESYFLKMSRKDYAKMLQDQLPKGVIIKVKKALSNELKEAAKKRFTTDKSSVRQCSAEEVADLLLNVMKNVLKIDVENDVDGELLKGLFVRRRVNGEALMAMDEEYAISNLLLPSLRGRYEDVDAHRVGKRYRYWPAYADNAQMDIYNGGTIRSWYCKPKFGDIKDEVLHNPFAPISVNQWNRTVLYASKIVQKTAAIKALKAKAPINRKEFGATSNSSFHKYGVRNDDKIRLEHLVPLLLFVDLDFVSKEVIRSCSNNQWRCGDQEAMQRVMKQHSNLAQITRLIRETVECYGQRWGEEPGNRTPTFYHLLDKDIVPSSLSLRLFGPLSVTTKLNTALVLNDFDDSEVVLQLRCGRDCNLRYFDCSWLSDYPLESEHIICGGLGTALIANVYDLCAGLRFDHHLLAINLFVAAISAKPLPKLDEKAMVEVAPALGAMMGAQFKRAQQGPDDAEDSKEPEPFMNAAFAAMCDLTYYGQLNLAEMKTVEIFKDLYQEKHGNIKFATLCGLLPNCSRFHVSLRGVDKEEAARILFSEKLIKYLTKTSGDAPSKLRGITFEVEAGVKIDVNACKGSGWTATSTKVVGDAFTVKLQRDGGGK